MKTVTNGIDVGHTINIYMSYYHHVKINYNVYFICWLLYLFTILNLFSFSHYKTFRHAFLSLIDKNYPLKTKHSRWVLRMVFGSIYGKITLFRLPNNILIIHHVRNGRHATLERFCYVNEIEPIYTV